MGWIWSFVVKITTWIRGTNLCINCTSSICLATSFMRLRNDTKCTKTLWNTPKHEFRVQWGESVSSLRKIQCDFVALKFVLIDPIQYVLKQVSCSYGTIPNAPKYYETYQNMSLGSNGVDLVHSLWKIPMRHRARTFALIATVQSVLHQASCSNKTIKNAPKHYEMQQYMSLGSNWVGRVHSFRKIPKQLHGPNLCINCTSSTHFVMSFV